MKKVGLVCMFILLAAGALSPLAAYEFSFHGDMNHRFQYSNQAGWLTLNQRGVINNGDVNEWFGEIKYRFWVEAATDDGAIKGVLGTEIGGLRFGETGKAPFSGDQIQFEVRWAYLDFQLPMVERSARSSIGLQPFSVNRYVWEETAAGVAFKSTLGDTMGYTLAWMRGAEYDKTAQGSDSDDDRTDLDSLLARLDLKLAGGIKGGAFVLYQGYDADGNPAALDSRNYEVKFFVSGGNPQVDFSLWSLGIDGALELGTLFFRWDLIYQNGEFDDLTFTDFASGVSRAGNFDLSAYLAHLDVGAKFGPLKLTYTFWYASGDDNAADDEFNAFIATDVDFTESIVLMEGNYADDNYFMETPYIADKGFIMNRLGIDFAATPKTTIGGALLYMLTAEDFEYTAAATGTAESSNELGFEIDAYITYMMYKDLEVSFNFGYLFAGDALDVYEVAAIQNGSSDEDIYIASARVRYKF
ncbi:MAG: hypothetical protein C4519_02765 [Desulfobacteraceae bacterium]|nr:MAG: hypothetical protein C4519_02765 [Desulfobacteraceae bacterium]